MHNHAVNGITLVLGGARSGKSRFAEKLVGNSGLQPVYLATGQALDQEMERRIEEHRQRRGSGWRTVEAPLELAEALRRETAQDHAVLVDCATLWLTNLMMADRGIPEAIDHLIDTLHKADGPVVIVSNEVGMGIVPENEMARTFRDHVGRLHQAIAEIAEAVYLVVAGQALAVKQG